MKGEQVREKLHRGELVYGTHVTDCSHAVSLDILGSAPLDCVFLCTEHMPVDRRETATVCRSFAQRGISPVVRISSPSAREAAMALDAGAHGVVAPYVESVAEVRELVGAVHYRPIKGRQLEHFLSGRSRPSAATRDFLGRFNRQQYAIIGVESVAAYENLDALIAVDGLDGVFLGAHDLSVSLEAPEQWDNPELFRLIADTVVRCRRVGIGVGLHLSEWFSIEQARRLIALGMNWVLDGADVVHTRQVLQQRRELLLGG